MTPVSFATVAHLDLNQQIKLQETFAQLVTIVLLQVYNFVIKALRVFTKEHPMLVPVCHARKETIVKVVLIQLSLAQQVTSVQKVHTSIRLQNRHQLLAIITLLDRNNKWHAQLDHTQELEGSHLALIVNKVTGATLSHCLLLTLTQYVQQVTTVPHTQV